jgi:hypothetical protein
MERMESIEEEFKKELYVLNEQIKVEELEQESMDVMINQLRGQLYL